MPMQNLRELINRTNFNTTNLWVDNGDGTGLIVTYPEQYDDMPWLLDHFVEQIWCERCKEITIMHVKLLKNKKG